MDSRLEYPDVVPSMASPECRFHATGNLHVMIRREVFNITVPRTNRREGGQPTINSDGIHKSLVTNQKIKRCKSLIGFIRWVT